MSMKTRSLVTVSGLLAATMVAVPAPAWAGEVYGRITMGTTSVGDGASVAAQCGDRAYAAKPTDKSGTYHIILGESGKCTLTVSYNGQSAGLQMVSYEDAVQYDIVLEMRDGKLAARRK